MGIAPIGSFDPRTLASSADAALIYADWLEEQGRADAAMIRDLTGEAGYSNGQFSRYGNGNGYGYGNGYGDGDGDSRISEAVETIYLSEVIEVIPCTAKAEENLKRSRNGA